MVRRRAASKITRAAHSRLSSAFGRERVDTLEVIDCQAEIPLMIRYIDATNRPLAILDVGWDRKWPLRLSVPYRLTGIDTDAEVMALRGRLGDVPLFPPESPFSEPPPPKQDL